MNCLSTILSTENQYTPICRRRHIDDREVKISFLNLEKNDKLHAAARSASRKETGCFGTDMNEIANREFLPCQEGNASHLNHKLLFPAIYFTVLAVLVGVYSQRHRIISQLFYYRLQRRYYNRYSKLSTERSVDVLSRSRLTSNWLISYLCESGE
jgi:hypothetical protein